MKTRRTTQNSKRLDAARRAKCDPKAGWEKGPGGKCVRAKPKEDRPAQKGGKQEQAGKPSAQKGDAAMQKWRMGAIALIGGVWAASRVKPTIEVAKAGVRVGQARAGEGLVPDKDLRIADEDILSRVKNKRPVSEQGQLSQVSFVEVDGEKKILKEEPAPATGSRPMMFDDNQRKGAYAYSASVEATVSVMAEQSGIPIAKSQLIPSDVMSKEYGSPRMGATLVDIAEGKEMGKTKGYEDVNLFFFPDIPLFSLDKLQPEHLQAMANPEYGDDAAKIMAFDTFIGNHDRHGANVFMADGKDGKKKLTGIDHGLSFLSDDIPSGIHKTIKKYRKNGTQLSPEQRKGLDVYCSTLEDLVQKNPPEKTRALFLSHSLKETGPEGKDGFGEQMSRIMKIDSSYERSAALAKELREYLNEQSRNDSISLLNEYSFGYIAAKGLRYTGPEPQEYLRGYLSVRNSR